MIRLAEEAREVKNGTRAYASSKSTSISFSSLDTQMTYSNEKYVSKTITPTVTNSSTYTVSVTGVDGIKVTDPSGNVKTSFTSGEGFVVSIPSSSVSSSENINVNVSAEGTIAFADIYTPSTNMANADIYQKIIGMDTKEGSITVSFNLTATHEEVCVNYVIVGNTTPDPSKTDPTPGNSCYTKGETYTEEDELNTTDNCTFNGWYTDSNLTEKWTNGSQLNDNLTLYGSWTCSNVPVDDTLAKTPFIILGLGLIIISVGTTLYLVKDNKKIKQN